MSPWVHPSAFIKIIVLAQELSWLQLTSLFFRFALFLATSLLQLTLLKSCFQDFWDVYTAVPCLFMWQDTPRAPFILFLLQVFLFYSISTGCCYFLMFGKATWVNPVKQLRDPFQGLTAFDFRFSNLKWNVRKSENIFHLKKAQFCFLSTNPKARKQIQLVRGLVRGDCSNKMWNIFMKGELFNIFLTTSLRLFGSLNRKNVEEKK